MHTIVNRNGHRPNTKSGGADKPRRGSRKKNFVYPPASGSSWMRNPPSVSERCVQHGSRVGRELLQLCRSPSENHRSGSSFCLMSTWSLFLPLFSKTATIPVIISKTATISKTDTISPKSQIASCPLLGVNRSRAGPMPTSRSNLSCLILFVRIYKK